MRQLKIIREAGTKQTAQNAIEAERQRAREEIEEASKRMQNLRDDALKQQGNEFSRRFEDALAEEKGGSRRR